MFPKIGGKTPKWMVYFMEKPIKMDDLGVPLFLETPISSHVTTDSIHGFKCGRSKTSAHQHGQSIVEYDDLFSG